MKEICRIEGKHQVEYAGVKMQGQYETITDEVTYDFITNKLYHGSKDFKKDMTEAEYKTVKQSTIDMAKKRGYTIRFETEHDEKWIGNEDEIKAKWNN